MESINTINKTLLGAALAVFVLVTTLPQESALARGARGGGMDVRTADLCLVTEYAAEDESEGIGTVAAVTDKRNGITAWAVSLEGMLRYEPLAPPPVYYVYDTGSGASDCGGEFVYTMTTDENGEAFRNTVGSDWTYIPEVGDVIQICRDNVPILEGVLVKGGKERNKPNRC